MGNEELRLECLRLAQVRFGGDQDAAVGAARKYADFVLGTKDAEVVQAAKTLAKAVADA